ncbi:PREDICTED: uncharacterized protein LOC109166615 [Ipomoea nil]|uniref:uncharacterized protein LOC109166615 n=1 Tax=Ipomoea nil TaxID=35883 RepID=UPI0009015F0C|nr:PREDICTED: uncharacterized protein LOC109166615 [Ipomoea nil]
MVCFECGLYGHRQDHCSKEGPSTATVQTTSDKETGSQNSPAIIKQGPPGKYGAWMLVTRKDRRNFNRNKNFAAPGDQRNDQQPATKGKEPVVEDIVTQSRFSSLADLEENHQTVPTVQPAIQTSYSHPQTSPRIRRNDPSSRNLTDRTQPIEQDSQHPFQFHSLPRIRTTARLVSNETDQIGMPSQQRPRALTSTPRYPRQGTRGGFRGRGGRGATPNQAAAEREHTVVHGTYEGRSISTTTVYHDEGTSSTVAELENNFKQNPPDTDPLLSTSREPPDISMSDMDRVAGQDGHSDIMLSYGIARVQLQGSFDEWFRIEAVGFSGRIWVLWKNSLSIEILYTHPQFALLQVKETSTQIWTLAVVYGSPNHTLRRRLFADLTAEALELRGPWLAAGDFNSVTYYEETTNPASYSQARCSDFNKWIFQEGLIDLGFEGPQYTWMRGNSPETFRAARLDRALSNIDWKLDFPNATEKHLPIIGSDHAPLLINTDKVAQVFRTKTFRFNMAWTTHNDFNKLVAQNWNNDLDLSTDNQNMAEALYKWNRESFGNIHQRKKRLLARIEGVQRNLARHNRADLLRLEKNLRGELDEVLYQEELLWFQRSRE